MFTTRNFSRKLYLDCIFYTKCQKLACPLDATLLKFDDTENVCKLSKETRIALAQTNKGVLKFDGLTKTEFELELKKHKI